MVVNKLIFHDLSVIFIYKNRFMNNHLLVYSNGISLFSLYHLKIREIKIKRFDLIINI